MRLHSEEKMKAQECSHHDNVATNTNKVTYFVDEKEPFIDISENRTYLHTYLHTSIILSEYEVHIIVI